ncbi:Eukaryotic/viral aspartic protease [Phytophthora megakarya]|uniref:Eukaryotic/viral aspartic protease n=1 Tax=Phytophthora megakarya TaxID=4795 RepID=A0A225UF53_9STRA|nr:Eukaryotic/viral aspartic protease [Phytophthora megakarya]
MGFTAIGVYIVDPESIRILVAGGASHARSAAREDIPRITASSYVADVESCMTWENFYNQIRQWFNPTKHMGMLPEARPSKIAEYRRSTTMDLLPGESRGYWKHHSPGKWFHQAKIAGKIHNEKAIILLDTGTEVSIVDTAFARKVGCYIDSSQIQDCVGI